MRVVYYTSFLDRSCWRRMVTLADRVGRRIGGGGSSLGGSGRSCAHNARDAGESSDLTSLANAVRRSPKRGQLKRAALPPR